MRDDTATQAATESGQPDFPHGLKDVCTAGVAYNNSAGMVLVLVHRNATSGAILARVTCQFNKLKDMRICEDFDTYAMTADMKNPDGVWHTVVNDKEPSK